MKLIKDTNPGAYVVMVKCLTCGKIRVLADMLIDTEGPAFRAYYCDPECRPVEVPLICGACGQALVQG